jgi:hypothetical protein
MGQFGRVLAFLATRPVPLGFEQILPAVFSENTESVGYLGRAGRIARAGWSG